MPRRRDEQKEATREHLFQHAMQLFDKRGYESVNVDEIVRKSKVARGTFYFHFPRKDDVLLEAIRRGERHIVDRMEHPRGTSLRQVLEACIDGFAEVWAERRALLAHAGIVSLRHIAVDGQERDRDPLRLALTAAVEHALATGELRAALPARMLADIFLLDVFVAAMAWASVGEPPFQVVMRAVIELFLVGAQGFGTDASTRPTRRSFHP